MRIKLEEVTDGFTLAEGFTPAKAQRET